MTAARYRSVALGVAWRNLHNFLTMPQIALPALLFPLFFFTAFAGGLSRISDAPGFDYPAGYTAFQFAFVVLQSAAFGGVFAGFGMARDFERGFGRRLLLAAPRRSAVLVGYALSALARAAILAVLLFCVAMVAGMDLRAGPVDLAGLALLALLVNIAASMWAAGIALRFRSIQAGPLMQMPVFTVLFLAPVYVPVTLLHSWIKTVAQVNPITPILEAVRSLLAGDATGLGRAFAVAAILAAVFVVWAKLGLRSAERAGG